MAILVLILVGLIVLLGFVLVGRLLGHAAAAAWLFIPVWFASAALNAAAGILAAKAAPMNEIGAFLPIFGIPTVVAAFTGRILGR